MTLLQARGAPSAQTIERIVTPKVVEAVTASVIIVNYNTLMHIGACLRALLETLPPGCEVIVVDNVSQDDSVAYISEHFPSVTLVQNSENGGYGHGNNVGVRHASGEFLVFLNPDTQVAHGWLDPLLDVLRDDDTVGMSTSKILLMNAPDRINTCGGDVHYTGLTLCRGMNAPATDYTVPLEVSAVSGAAFAMRRSVFDVLGGFDEALFMYMDDTDLSWRVRLLGLRCVLVPQSVVYHDYTLRFGAQKTYYQERNRYTMLLKTLRWPTLLLMLPTLLAAEAITWGFVLLRERRNRRNKLRAYTDLLRDWPTLMRERRRVQALRHVPDRALLAACVATIDFAQTGDSLAARLASRMANPFFRLGGAVLRALVWW